MKNSYILNWHEIVDKVAETQLIQSRENLSSLITYARQFGVGKPISYQKTVYSKCDLEMIGRIIKIWQYIKNNSSFEWFNNRTIALIQKMIINSIIKKKTIQFYAVFCPSYKKDYKSFGYTGKIGNHTQLMIAKYSNLILGLSDLGLAVKAVAFFSDLLLENYDKLLGTNYKNDLKNNYSLFKKELVKKSKGIIAIRALSSIKELNLRIGEEGCISKASSVPSKVYKRVFIRNKIFYKKNFGWSDKMVEERTTVLASCYAILGHYFRENYQESTMYWVESAYERSSMYSGFNQDTPIPIIFPKNDRKPD